MGFLRTWHARIALILGLTAALMANALGAQTIVDLSQHTNLKGTFLIQQPKAENLRVDLFFEVGESDNSGPEGLSHYVEHLVAWSADRANRDNLHARSMNAWASSFFTNYHNLGPHDRLSNILSFAAGVFEPIELQRSFMRSERNIVEREFDLGYTENVGNRLYLAVLKALYPDHARGRSTIGSRESIRQITVEQALAFHQQNYSADRATLLISGNLDADDVVGLLQQKFSDLPVVPFGPRPFTQPLTAPQEAPVVLRTTATTTPSVLTVYHAQPSENAPTGQDLATFDLLQQLLMSALPGGLNKPLYFDDFWVENVESWIDFQPGLHPQLHVWEQPDVDVTPEDLLTQIDATLRQIAQDGIPADSLETVRASLIETRQRLMKEPDAQRRYAHNTALHLPAPLSFEASIKLLEAVTLEQVNTALRRLVYSKQHASGIAFPKE